MATIDVRQTVSANELALSVAAEISHCLETAIAERGHASLVVSGGKTPILTFRYLSDAALDWSRVTITLADERWVSPKHHESNEFSIRQHLLVRRAASARFISLKADVAHPVEAINTVSERIAMIATPFDVVLLGMGTDGHTASWFPDSPTICECLETNDLCCSLESAMAGYPRMTLTPAAILNAQRILLQFTGDRKREVFSRARLPGALEVLPVRTILHQNKVPVGIRYSAHDMPADL